MLVEHFAVFSSFFSLPFFSGVVEDYTECELSNGS